MFMEKGGLEIFFVLVSLWSHFLLKNKVSFVSLDFLTVLDLASRGSYW